MCLKKFREVFRGFGVFVVFGVFRVQGSGFKFQVLGFRECSGLVENGLG